MAPTDPPPSPPISITLGPSSTPSPPASLWERISTWAADNKAAAYTIAGVVVVVTGAGIVYAVRSSSSPDSAADAERRASKKERRKAKKDREAAAKAGSATDSKQAKVEDDPGEELPEVNEASVAALSNEERKDLANRLKGAGNKAYGDKRYNDAIDLYGRAILCRPDPVYYSNRAACYSALGEWNKVVDDSTAALSLDKEYVKALNRRANAYRELGQYEEALLDYTASCIIDNFRSQASSQAVEDLLKKIAEIKADSIMASKIKKLPGATFITNFLQSFRTKPLPPGLEKQADLDEDSGLGKLRTGLIALQTGIPADYEKAKTSFEEALTLGELGDHQALAYNMRGTFQYLCGDNDAALADLTESINLRSDYTESFIKRASMHLEIGEREAANKDFEQAVAANSNDPDIYYHRAQLHFIMGEYAEAARDFQKSIDLDKDFIFSHIQLGVTQYKMGSVASSMATFRRCLKNFDRTPAVYTYYGELLMDQSKFQEAIEKFDTAVEMERQTRPLAMNVLPLINKALAVFQWKTNHDEAIKICQKALIIDPESDIAVATMAQLLLQSGKVPEALEYFDRAADISRTHGETVNAISYAVATRVQLDVQQKYPQLTSRLQAAGSVMAPPPGGR